MITILSSLLLCAAIVPHASAHLMVAQHGTLNFKDDGVFIVLSLPVSAFENIDDDGDGKMSGTEFSTHRRAIKNVVNQYITLSDVKGQRPLQGLILSPIVPHDDPNAASEQLVLMGRFSLANKEIGNSDGLTFKAGLFGTALDEKSLSITATRKLASDPKTQKYTTELSPDKSTDELFKS